MEEVKEIINNHFKDDKAIFFHQSDRHLMEEPNAYLRYQFTADKLWLYAGSDNTEYLLLITDNPERLDNLIKVIIHGL
ncbi:hypothetical protein J2810_004589 [Chryseobacterium rhizosphaerae]|uniref:hypothetical protein n=1 Tax=Chryseobacterium rhizosphaerae TaxID=395937 RepID=UPI0028582A9F|nr:hypothetical protein [Chryseobacterium rhizosphaerae]MDR6548499.1 hypothetical protein [Chryseobacterium rhizosphaerae]